MKNAGFILITTLLFLICMTLFIMGISEELILQQKLHQQQQLQQQLFNQANQGLWQGEHTLQTHCSAALCITVKKIDEYNAQTTDASVQIIYYAVTARAQQGEHHVTLQSTTVQMIPALPEIDGIYAGRQSWQEISA